MDTLQDPESADRLESWKEIAAYLRRDVTTVQRWEKREGLPVRRHLHDKLGSVYAHKAELDAWRTSRIPSGQDESTAQPSTSPRPFGRAALIVGVGVLMVAAGLWLFRRAEGNPSEPSALHLALPIVPPWEYQPSASGGLAVSRDGRQVAYLATDGTHRQLFLRRLDQPSPITLSNAADASGPVFSADGHWVAFSTRDALYKVAVNGGLATKVCDLPAPTRGMFWHTDGSIFYSLSIPGGVHRVNADGGPSSRVTTPSASEMFHRRPWIGAAGELYYVAMPPMGDGVVYRHSLTSGERSVAVLNARGVQAWRPDQLLFVRGSALFATALDGASGASTGQPVQLAEDVVANIGGADYGVGDDGTIVYAAGPSGPTGVSMVWVSRDGVETVVHDGPVYQGLSLSPDGRRVAVSTGGTASQIVVHDLARQRQVVLTTSGDSHTYPLWTPDGQAVTYRHMRPPETMSRIVEHPVDGTRAPRTVFEGTSSLDHQQPASWSGDGGVLLTENVGGVVQVLERNQPLRQIHPAGEGINSPHLSRDGRWLAYVSQEGGTSRVYVQPYPSLSGRWLISPEGGTAPRWSRDGRRLFFMNGNRMMEVDIRFSPAFEASQPRELFAGEYLGIYDVSAADRFLMLRPKPAAPIRQLKVVLPGRAGRR